MPGTWSYSKTFVNGEVLTHTDLNGVLNDVLTNFVPAGMDDYSTNASQMQSVTDPYPASVASLATSLAGELERIRYLLAQVTGETYWYIDPDASIAGIMAGTAKVGNADTLDGHDTSYFETANAARFTAQSSVAGSRNISGTVYQNNTGRTMFIIVTMQAGGSGGSATATTDSAASPTTIVAISQAPASSYFNISFMVTNGNYYKVTSASSPSLFYWVEWS